MIRQQTTPAGVCEDHQFGHDPIERCVTATLNDPDLLGAIGLTIDIERKINSITQFGLAAELIAFSAQRQSQAPEGSQRKRARQIGGRSAFGCLIEQSLRHHALEMIMTQVLGDPDPINARETIDDSSPGFIEIDVHRKRRQVPPGVERPAFDGVVRQHRDLVARHVDRRHTGAADLVERRPRGEITPGSRNMDSDPQPPIGKQGHRECIVDLGRCRIVD